ncbi:hypothetical protein LJC72_10920, partial [Bacteroides sp. OttesenSCG-928-D19]|nr:hypothetical protein [Bacteroides sp. OttesenSCG-928-D19]
MMNVYISIGTNKMGVDAVCALINECGMRGYGMYLVETLRMLARKCRVKFAFLLSVITDFRLFDVEETEGYKIRISSEYVNRVVLPYDEKVRRCKELE